MRSIQIESWALDVIKRVEAGQPNEDTRVELKAGWIDPDKTARHIAGHANAASGEPILWLIGIDQSKGVIGVDHNELANWYPAVASQFDGMAPVMVDINIPYLGKTIVALLFETDRAPFVVRNPDYGVKPGVSIAYEVPWREGTSTRTANRSDLIRLLVPILKLPEIEILEGKLTLRRHDKYRWSFELQLYITPQEMTPVVIPFHRCIATIKLPALENLITLENLRLSPPYKLAAAPVGIGWKPDSYTIAHTENELILQGPGRVNFYGEAWSDELPIKLEGSTVEIQVMLFPTHTYHSVVLTKTMVWAPADEKNEISRWTLL
ncbi:MAG: ATP-binding protein [Nitrososphaera sp.]|nr:ATP-binding protein [Nitrososphaera sp.]